MTARAEPLVATDRIELAWSGIDHSEGVAIDADGTVWAGGEEGQVYRGRLDGEPEQVATLPGRTLGFAIDADGNAYCADMSGPGIYRITPAGEVAQVSSGSEDQPARVPNHPAFLPDGTLLWTDSGEWGASDGCLFATRADGSTVVADRSANGYTNGLALSPDGTTLAIVESTLPGVTAVTVGSAGSLGERRVLVELPGTVPDGVAYDAGGRLYVSCWMPDAIYRVARDGEVETLAEDPLRFSLNSPTNVAFVPGERRLVAANIGERFLSVIPTDAPGAELPRPEFPWSG